MKITKLTILVLTGILFIGSGIVQAQEKLGIAIEGVYPPFSEKSASGELIGFDVDIAKALCAEMKVECELIEQNWDGIIPALLAKKYDAIIASMSITEKRKKVVDFTNKYYNIPARFAAKEGMFTDDSPEALAGKRIGCQRGTTGDDFLSSVYKNSKIVRYANTDEMFLDIAAGRIDALLADAVPISYGFLKTSAGKGYAFFGKDHNDPKYRGEGVGIAVRKGENELRERLNAAIQAIRDNGTYQKIMEKYFDFDIYGG